MASHRYVSSKEIIRKVFRDLRPPNAEFMHDAVEWIGEALEHIGAASQLCKKTCIIDIKDHRGSLPNDLYTIEQVAVNTCSSPQSQAELAEISRQIDELNGNLTRYYESVRSTVTSNSNGQYISTLTPDDLKDYDTWHATTLSQLNVLNSRMAVLEQSWFQDQRCLQPIAYGTSTFLPQSGCEDCPQPQRTKLTYYINCGTVQTSFPDGHLCISYTAFLLDDQCWPMVPDNISYREAMFWYIAKKLLLQGYQMRNSDINYVTAEQMWWKYCTQARNSMVFPDMAKYQSFMDQWVRLLPNLNRDLNFFEDLNDREALQRDNY